MKKQKQVPLGVSAITSRNEAIMAYFRGDRLEKIERKTIVTEHYPKGMSFRKACLIAIKYSLGLIDEVKAKIYKLTLAWLRLGEKMWEKIFRSVQSIRFSLTFGYSVGKFFGGFIRSLSCYEPMW